MALQNAINFIRTIRVDSDLRKALYHCESGEVVELLTENGLRFSIPEFDDAVTSLLVKCQFEEDAIELREIALWYKMLINKEYYEC